MLAQSVETLTTSVSEMRAQITQLEAYKQATDNCAASGQLYDDDASACVDPSGSDGTSLASEPTRT